MLLVYDPSSAVSQQEKRNIHTVLRLFFLITLLKLSVASEVNMRLVLTVLGGWRPEDEELRVILVSIVSLE